MIVPVVSPYSSSSIPMCCCTCRPGGGKRSNVNTRIWYATEVTSFIRSIAIRARWGFSSCVDYNCRDGAGRASGLSYGKRKLRHWCVSKFKFKCNVLLPAWHDSSVAWFAPGVMRKSFCCHVELQQGELRESETKYENLSVAKVGRPRRPCFVMTVVRVGNVPELFVCLLHGTFLRHKSIRAWRTL